MARWAAVDMLKEAFRDWREDHAPRLGAALSYYTVFSLAPLLVIAVAVAGLVFGAEAAQGRIVDEMSGLLGPKGAEAIKALLENARQPEAGLLATVIGLLTLFLGATGAFNELRAALDIIWEVPPPPSKGILGGVRDRFASFALVLVIGFLLLVSLLVSAALAAAQDHLDRTFPGAPFVFMALNAIVSFAVVTVLFALIYKVLPDTKIAWRDVWVGALFTAALFTVGKLAIGLYLGRGTVGSVYGAAGSLAIILAWVYYAAQILFFGAELTQVYATRRGSRAFGAARAAEAAAPSEAARRPGERPVVGDGFGAVGAGGNGSGTAARRAAPGLPPPLLEESDEGEPPPVYRALGALGLLAAGLWLGRPGGSPRKRPVARPAR